MPKNTTGKSGQGVGGGLVRMEQWTAVNCKDAPVDEVENRWGRKLLPNVKHCHCFEDQLLTIISNGVVLFAQYTKKAKDVPISPEQNRN